MSSANRRTDKTNEAAPLGWASVRKKDFTSTPHSVLTQLTRFSLIDETRIIAQLDVPAVALDRAIRIADANDINAAGVLAEEPMLEAEVADKVHFVLHFGAAHVIARRFRSPEHGRGPQLGLVLIERGIRALCHRAHR